MGSFHHNGEEDVSLTEVESESLLLIFSEEEAGITTVIAQAEAEQCQEFCPSSVKRQGVAPIRRSSPKSFRDGARRQNKHSVFRQPVRRTRSRKKMKKDLKTPTPFEPYGNQRCDMSCCSNIYTSIGASPELRSQPESVYIYAESVEGCDASFSSVSQKLDMFCFRSEVEKTCSLMDQVPGSESAKIGSSIDALFGSDTSCDSESIRGDWESDSSCINADWERSFDSDSDCCNLVYSFVEAHWGSASSYSGSAASGYITDSDFKSLVSNTEQHGSAAVNCHFEKGHFDLAGNHFEGGCHDLPVSHFMSGHYNSPDGCFDAGRWDTPVSQFDAGHLDLLVRHFHEGGRDFIMDHFETRHYDSPDGLFEAGHCVSPVGHCERGHCDSPVGHFHAGNRDYPAGHFDESSCDLYNAFPESSDAVCCRSKDQSDIFNCKDYTELIWRNLHGVVTHPDRYHVAPFFHEMMNVTEHDRNQEKVKINKGFLFHPQRFLQAKNAEYREGQEYSVLRHVQNGSYGDVFSVRDKQTGFTCAAKKIPLSSFSWEEVGTWSRLDSPRVLQLYGAVREDLNVVLFMDLKTGSLAQFLKAKGQFEEELALYYHRQVLEALEHLHRRNVIHLDVKVDNVLLSKDKMECFLCDFGLSEMLDITGYSTKTFRGNGLRGTESHMSPEVTRGDPRSDKADVWSSCCMLLHMLSGHQPWTRYYTHPLCLKIVSEPAPLWEIPAGCNPLTCDVIRGGLVKEPGDRDSARELLEKSSRALRAVGNLFDPVQSAAQSMPHPQVSSPTPSHNVLTKPPVDLPTVTESIAHTQEELSAPRIQWVSRWRERAADEDSEKDSDGEMDRTESWMEDWGLKTEYTVSEDENDGDGEMKHSSEKGWRERKRNEEDEESTEEMESDLGSLRELGSEDEWEPFHHLQILYGLKRRCSVVEWSETEEECVSSVTTSLNHLNLCDGNSVLTLACHRSICTSDADITDKGSDWSDDLSSGVFSSYSSLTDEQSFTVDWSVSADQPPSCSFDGLGVDIWVEDVSGETFRIRESLRVKLGHVAIGISSQVSMRTFSLATLDGKLVSPDTEVLESRMWLLCVPAPDNSSNWTWRIRDGKMETQEAEGLQSDTCSTLEA